MKIGQDNLPSEIWRDDLACAADILCFPGALALAALLTQVD